MKQISYLLIILVSLILYGTGQAQSAETMISIPSIGVSSSIIEAPVSAELQTWDVSHLAMTVGHLQYTAWFGQQSNIALAGHSENANGEPDIFYNLEAIQVGDEIIVQTAGTTYRYVVSRLDNIASSDLSVLYPTQVETLTLITCDIGSYTGNNTYSRRHVVIAERIYE